jgi:hypothetical protein
MRDFSVYLNTLQSNLLVDLLKYFLSLSAPFAILTLKISLIMIGMSWLKDKQDHLRYFLW